MSDADKLLPCPSCGSDELFTDTSYAGFVVSCDNCSMRGSLADWNTRATLQPAPDAAPVVQDEWGEWKFTHPLDKLAALQAHADALARYGEHTSTCDIMTHGVWSDPTPCTCGWGATFRSYEAFKAGEPT